MYNNYTIEDGLLVITGNSNLVPNARFKVNLSDTQLFSSLATQILKESALTDRQYNLLFEKMSVPFYENQFLDNGMTSTDYKLLLSVTRHPLRILDRSKTITLVDGIPPAASAWHNSIPMIKICFPFSKRIIMSVEAIVKIASTHQGQYYVAPNNRDHYIKCTEVAALATVNMFSASEFDIDPALIDYAEKVAKISEYKEQFVPFVKDKELMNFHPKTRQFLLDHVGEPCEGNALQYKDISLLYGINHVDGSILEPALCKVSVLAAKLANRTSTQVLVSPALYRLDDLISALRELNRFPLLVIVGDDTALTDITAVYSAVSQLITDSEMSVLFRLDNDSHSEFNDYVRDHGFNTPVTNDTKVVVISKAKLPKPLLKSEWKPTCVLRMGSTRLQTYIDQWIHECDLVIHYDSVVTQWQTRLTKRRTTETI